MLAQKPQLPRRATSGISWRGPRRETHLSGARRARRGPRLEAATDSAAEVDLSEDGSKEPETLRWKWEQTERSQKKAQGYLATLGQVASP